LLKIASALKLASAFSAEGGEFLCYESLRSILGYYSEGDVLVSKRSRKDDPDKDQKAARGGGAKASAGGQDEPTEGVVADKALTDRTRVRIMGVGNKHMTSPSDFSRETGEDLSRVAYHFRVLRDKGYLELVEEVKVRGSVKHMYKGTRRALVKDAEWRLYNAGIKAGFRTATLQDFVTNAAEAIVAETFDALDDSNFSWKALWLDEQGWIDTTKIMKRAYDEVMEVEVASAERAAKAGAALFAVTFAIAGFESPAKKQPEKKAKKKPKRGRGKRSKS
jgi:DNA-binding transcriptional ArsR family regulator